MIGRVEKVVSVILLLIVIGTIFFMWAYIVIIDYINYIGGLKL